MQGKLAVSAAGLASVAALAIAPAVFGAGAKTVTKVKCSGTFTSLTPHQLKGEVVGMISCGAPLGKGIQWVPYTETLSSTGAATAHGPFKAWFDTGTLSGTYKLAGKLVTGTSTLSGPAKVTGGTGVYKGAHGTGTNTCTTKDAGATLNCKFTLRFTKL